MHGLSKALLQSCRRGGMNGSDLQNLLSLRLLIDPLATQGVGDRRGLSQVRFLVTVIKDLLGLCEQKKGKDNKAIIASTISPSFSRTMWTPCNV